MSDEAARSAGSASGSDEDEFHDAPAFPADGEYADSSGGSSGDEAEPLTEEEVAARRDAAQAKKAEGNALYAEGKYEEAAECYTEAIATATAADDPAVAVFFGNRGACWHKLGQLERSLNDCTNALRIQPDYVKVLLRRATVFEALDKPHDAATDLKTVLEHQPENPLALRELPRVSKKAEEKFERDKEEMMAKLKTMGNSLLGKFGLSVDNFQAVQDPNTGSYSVNFRQNPSSESPGPGK